MSSAYDSIKQAILSGTFGAGELLTETQLATFCNVSRTPVREAVHRLEIEQFLARTDRGLMVSNPSPEEIYELYEARGLVNMACGRLAAERRTELDLATIDRWFSAMQTVEDAATKVAASHEFSRAVWRASHNRSLVDILERIGLPHSRFGGQTTMVLPGQAEAVLINQTALRESIIDRDPDAAAEVMLRQNNLIRDARIRIWHARNNTPLAEPAGSAVVAG